MTEVVSWAATVVLVLAVVGLFAHLVEVFRAPTRRPRVPKRDRFGELVAED